jgi:hypothetical protein
VGAFSTSKISIGDSCCSILAFTREQMLRLVDYGGNRTGDGIHLPRPAQLTLKPDVRKDQIR